MAINPITGKEENPVTTGSSTGNITTNKIDTWIENPLSYWMEYQIKPTPPVTSSISTWANVLWTSAYSNWIDVWLNKAGTATNTGIVLPDATNTIEIKTEIPKVTTTDTVPGTTVWTTEIKPQTDIEKATSNDVNKNYTQSQENINNIYKNYNIIKWQYETNKNYYTNYDEVNNKVNKAFDLIQNTQVNVWNRELNDTEYQNIANQTWLTIDQVKNPTSVFNSFVMTDEGKRKLWVTKAENDIAQYTTDFERQKADIKTKTDQAQQNYDWQIEDINKQLQRNLTFMESSWVWSGASKSSGYQKGMENVKTDWQETIKRLQTLAEQMKNASAEDVWRLTDDYNKGIATAKLQLDDQMKQIKEQTWLNLNVLTTQYWTWSPYLGKLLTEEMNKASNLRLDAISKAQDMILKNNQEARTQADYIIKYNETLDNVANKKYTELTANNGFLLQNTSLTTLWDMFKKWDISAEKYKNLQSIMLSWVQSALNKIAPMTENDQATVKYLLDIGLTPAEVINKRQSTDKFGNSFETNFTDLKDWMFYDKKAGKIITKEEMIAKVNTTHTAPAVTDTNSIINYSENKRGKINLQCWELANDYWQQQTGSPAGLWDSLNSKNNAVNKIGSSKIPVAWWLFVINNWTSYWHTGIVQSVNADWSITVLEANAAGKTQWQPAKTTTYSADKVKWMLFSQAPAKNISNVTAIATSGTTARIPDVNNNPWDLKMWDVWYWVDKNWFTIFANATEGANALIKDLIAKATGNTTTWLTWNSTFEDLSKKYTTTQQPKWLKNATQTSWYSADTKLKDMDIVKLAQWVANAEWFTGTITGGWITSKTEQFNPNLEEYYKSKDIPWIETLKSLWKTAEQFLKEKKAYKDAQPKSTKLPKQTTFTQWEIWTFNSSKYNPQTDKNADRVAKYEDFLSYKNEVQANPNSDIKWVMEVSRNQKSLSESWNKTYKDMNTVVWQLGRLNSAITKYNDESKWWFSDWILNPINWLIANKNPWDTKAQDIKAQLQATVPKIARWIFWEVWVLTDTDIANYIQTLPNIKQTADVQDVVQLSLLWTLKNALDWAIRTDSATYDTSWLQGNYKRLTTKIDELTKKISWKDTIIPYSTSWKWPLAPKTYTWRIKL